MPLDELEPQSEFPGSDNSRGTCVWKDTSLLLCRLREGEENDDLNGKYLAAAAAADAEVNADVCISN